MAPSTDPREVLTRTARAPDLTLRYREGADAEVDVRLPPAEVDVRLPPGEVDVRLPPADGDVRPPRGRSSLPLVLVLHGGFWRPEYDRHHAAAQSAALADAGHVVATVEYRRAGWPVIFDDIALLTDIVPSLVARAVGPDVVDVTRTVLVGHSAGGHLAVWAASRHRLPRQCPWHRSTPLPVAGVVALAGVLDLHLADRLRLDGDATDSLLGGTAAQVPDRFAVTDPAMLVPTGVPTICVHGKLDDIVPIDLSHRYASAAGVGGDDVEVRAVEDAEHFAVIDPRSTAWPVVLSAVDEIVG
jgi:acetyl esterase/lipase